MGWNVDRYASEESDGAEEAKRRICAANSDIPLAAEIVDRIVAEADQILSGRRNSSTALKA